MSDWNNQGESRVLGIRLKIIKIWFLHEQMYYMLIKRNNRLLKCIYFIGFLLVIVNAIGTATDALGYAVGVSSAILGAIMAYLVKIKEDGDYQARIERHRKVFDLASFISDEISTELGQAEDKRQSCDAFVRYAMEKYTLVTDQAELLEVDPDIYGLWDIAAREKGILESNQITIAMDITERMRSLSGGHYDASINIPTTPPPSQRPQLLSSTASSTSLIRNSTRAVRVNIDKRALYELNRLTS